MKNLYRFLAVAVVVILSSMLMTSQVFAASKTAYFFDRQMSITDTAGKGDGNESSYTITANGSLFSKATNTITITNETDTKAIIAFAYSASSANLFTIAGAATSASGNYSATVGGGKSITIVLQSNSGFSDTTATLTLTAITFTPEAKSSEITINFDSSLGAVTVDGVDFVSGDTITIEESGSKQLSATPGSNARFIAWADEDGTIISFNSSYAQESFGNKTIRALFSENTPYFKVDDIYVFSDLNDAVEKTKNGSIIVLICDGILPKGAYNIPTGTTLLIPFDAAHTPYTEKPGCVNVKYEDNKPLPYRILTMASGANIIVNGAISISAEQSCSQNSNGSPVGAYGLVTMEDGSEITVNNNGKLYVWGYITGSGKITAKSGSTVCEDFQVRDWRGGTATTDMIGNDNRVFPMSQYYVQNIEVPLTLEAGAIENGYMSVFVSGKGILDSIEGSVVPFIGSSGMFRIESGSITKDYDEETDRLIINVDGTLNMAPLSISMKISLLGTQTINSASYTLPINGNITLHINLGSEVNISQDLALLPGGVINVYNGAKCTFSSGSKIFVYDSEEWGNYCSHHNKKIMPVNYAPGGKYTRTEADLVDAQVYIAGTVDTYNGNVYTTASGANIHGTEGGLVKLKSDENTTVTYQATYLSENDPTMYHNIPVTTANLKNADDTYTDPESLGGCCSTYIYSGGEWIPENINHTNVIVTQGLEPTCDEEGKTEGSYCGACETVIKEQEVIPALEHDYGDFVFLDKVNHKKVCSNDSAHIITQPHTFDGFNCSECGCEKIVTDTKYTIDSEKIIINASLVLDVPANTQIIIATYDSFDRLLDTSHSTKELLDDITLPSTGVKMIKVFAWDGFNTMSPISGVEIINVL